MLPQSGLAKICNRCKRELSVSDFYPIPRGMRRTCKQCISRRVSLRQRKARKAVKQIGKPWPNILDCIRFQKKIERKRSCWQWGGLISDQGYGRFCYASVQIKAHMFSWMLSNGRRVPPGLELDHICNNRRCVNPRHLEAVTHLQNMSRAAARGSFDFRKRSK